ncbi:hypothetical protein [Lichenicola cladoniae]
MAATLALCGWWRFL